MRSGSGMVGIGMCPEGIEQNPIVYDLMSEWAFRCILRFYVSIIAEIYADDL